MKKRALVGERRARMKRTMCEDRLKLARTKTVIEFFIFMFHSNCLGKNFPRPLVENIVHILWNSRRDNLWL